MQLLLLESASMIRRILFIVIFIFIDRYINFKSIQLLILYFLAVNSRTEEKGKNVLIEGILEIDTNNNQIPIMPLIFFSLVSYFRRSCQLFVLRSGLTMSNFMFQRNFNNAGRTSKRIFSINRIAFLFGIQDEELECNSIWILVVFRDKEFIYLILYIIKAEIIDCLEGRGRGRWRLEAF